MKTINGQNQHVLGGRLAGITVRRTLRRLGVKNLPGKAGWLRGKLVAVPPSEKYAVRISSRPKNISPENTSLDTGGFSSIMLLAHPLAIVYITSCLQDNRMIYVSPQIVNLGFTPEVLLGEPDFRLQQVYEEDSERVDQAIRHSCVTAEKFSCHYRLYDSNRKVHWFHDEASVVCDESGTPLLIRGVMLNITDKMGMEAELKQHRYNLERNVELRTEQLVRRATVLESCNKALCDKLALAMKNLATLNRQPEHALPGAV